MERKNQYLILSMVCHMVKDKNWKILIKSGPKIIEFLGYTPFGANPITR